MDLSGTAFQHRRLVFALVGIASLYGLASYFTLKSREDPKILNREAVVTTRFPGLSPEQVELLITKTLEEAISEMEEVDEIRSSSIPGVSIIHVGVQDKFFELDQIWDELRDEVERVTPDLPEGTIPPVINDRFGDVAVVTAALTSPGAEWDQRLDVAQHIRDTLLAVPGTKRIELLGARSETIYIEFEDAKLANLGIDPTRIISVLREQNTIRPGGEVIAGGQNVQIGPSGNFRSIEEIREAPIPLPQTGKFIPLRDIAEVSRVPEDPPLQAAYFNGEPAIVLAITKVEEADTRDYSVLIREKIAELNPTLPAGFQLEIATFQAKEVERAVTGVSINVLQTLVIVLAVVVVFLGFRTGLIVGFTVPVVMLITLAVMNMTGIQLQRMSLATLIISLGLLVDNGIVVAERFIQQLEEGKDRREVLSEIGKELSIPLLTSSLTTILVFLPLMLAQSDSGEYTRSISLVILITLSISWLLALLVTPTLCYFFAKTGSQKNKATRRKPFTSRLFEWMGSRYRNALRLALSHRILTLSLVVLLFMLAGMGMGLTRTQFFPASDRAQIMIYVELPPNASSQATDQTVQEMLRFIGEEGRYPSVQDRIGYVGFGGPRFVLSLTPVDPAPYRGVITLVLDEFASVAPTRNQLRFDLAEKFPETRLQVTEMFLGPTDSSVLDVQVKGPDENVLFESAQRIEAALREIEDVIEVRNDWEGRQVKFDVVVDQVRARAAGVSSASIAAALEQHFSGVTISEFRENDDIYPIVMRGVEKERTDLGLLESISVYSGANRNFVPLNQVADLSLVTEFVRRERENLQRTITITAKNPMLSAEELKPLLDPEIEAIRSELPLNHSIEYDGVIADSIESQASLTASIPLCFGLIFLTLLAQFNSFRKTLLIFLTFPLIIIGSVIGLLVLQAPFGFMVMLGMYALIGILANNAIVLVDRIDTEIGAAYTTEEKKDALVNASVVRLRPIVMSTVTTVFGLLPLILAKDVLFFGLATVLAFGLAIGTVFTLVVVPVLYSLFFRIRYQIQK